MWINNDKGNCKLKELANNEIVSPPHKNIIWFRKIRENEDNGREIPRQMSRSILGSYLEKLNIVLSVDLLFI